MDLNELKSRIKACNLSGCYVFAGEEDYLKRYYLGEIRNALVGDPTLAAFNHSIFEGADINFAQIRDAIKSPPVFANFKLIEWRYPSFTKAKESDLKLFEETLDLLYDHPYATLAFIVADGELDFGTPKKESRFVKRFKDKLNLFNMQKSTDAQLNAWLKKHFDSYGINASQAVCGELVFRAGRSMSVLKSEVDKLSFCAIARGLKEIDSQLVREVASSTPESDTFALSNAILERNKIGAFTALEEMKRDRLDPIVILGMMERSYVEIVKVLMLLGEGMDSQDISRETGIHPYLVKRYISHAGKFTKKRAVKILDELVRVDTGLKYGGIASYTAIEIFISKCV